jgi:hypothetical protein
VKALAPLLVAALALGCSRSKPDPYAEETRAREAFVKKALLEADASRAYGMSSNGEVQFEEGFGVLSYELDSKDGHASITNHAFRWMGQTAHARLKTHGKAPMRLRMGGWVHEKVVQTRPVLSFYVDGAYLGSTEPVGGDGHYHVDLQVPGWALRRPWVDLVVRTNAVGFHWADVPELRVLNVYTFEWSED